MKKTKKILIFISFFAFSVLINVIPLIVFKDKAAVSEQSYYSIIIMILVSIYGISAYFLRHEGIYLMFQKYRFPVSDDDIEYTYTTEYMNNFYLMFLIYWLAVPFYIPCIFFVSKWEHTLWTICVLLTPQIIYLILGIFDTLKNIKEYQLKQQQLAQELKEQQAREEMGHFK